MKRVMLGTLAIVAGAIASIPAFVKANDLERDEVLFLLYLVGACVFASPVVLLRLVAGWPARTLLASAGLAGLVPVILAGAWYHLLAQGYAPRDEEALLLPLLVGPVTGVLVALGSVLSLGLAEVIRWIGGARGASGNAVRHRK